MIEIPFASSFVVGGILTLLVPVAVLIAIGVWHMRVVARVTSGRLPEAQAPGTPPPVSDVSAPEV